MILHRLALLLALTTSTVLAARPPTVVNLSFQQHDAVSGRPDGWSSFGAGYDLSTECAPACAVRIQSRDPAAQVFGMFQEIAPGTVAGHRLTLSGRIRTEQAEGNAFFAISVVGEKGPNSDKAEGPAAPNGSTAWKRFEVTSPIPPDATKVMIGFGIGKKGSAWFDSLELKLDDSVVASVAAPPPPARPVPSQRLLDDAALRLAEADLPDIAPAWRADVLARRHPIRSLFSDDFSDLQFLKPLLAGKRIVQLGESNHGAAEMNWMKVRLIKFLHQEMGFDVLAVESSMSDCDVGDKMVGTAPAADVLRRCMMWQWHTSEVRPLFDYLKAARKSAAPLTLAGFDTQLSAPTGLATGTALRPLLPVALGDQLAGYDAQLGNDKRLTAETAQPLRAFYAQALDALAGRTGPEIDFQRQALRSRDLYVRQLAITDAAVGGAMRDAGMAENLNFLLDRHYPKRKVIVWAHNAHVAYGHPYLPYKNMGAILAAQRKTEMYTIGLYMGRGMYADNFGRPATVPTVDADSLDGVLANGGLRYSLVDFSSARPSTATSWIFEPFTVREFGVNRVRMVPGTSYDAVLYIDTVTPAEKF